MIDSRDDIGFHWDRDYGVEEELQQHIYPEFATVTYLSQEGGPTVIVDKVGTDAYDDEFLGELEPRSRDSTYILSCPRILKHIRFSGNLLHAASSVFVEEDSGSDGKI